MLMGDIWDARWQQAHQVNPVVLVTVRMLITTQTMEIDMVKPGMNLDEIQFLTSEIRNEQQLNCAELMRNIP